MFFYRSIDQEFGLLEFILPLLFIAFPTLFFVSCLAVLLEVVFPKILRIQYVLFIVIFILTLLCPQAIQTDLYGISYPEEQLISQVSIIHPGENISLAVGIMPGKREADKLVALKAISYPFSFIKYRLFWMLFGMFLVVLASLRFHRFDLSLERDTNLVDHEKIFKTSSDFRIECITEGITFAPGIKSLVYAELVMMIRKNKKGLSALILCGMIAMIFVPVSLSHCYLLPTLWFLQMIMWTDLTPKDKDLRTDYLSMTSLQPVKRIICKNFGGIDKGTRNYFTINNEIYIGLRTFELYQLFY